MARGNKGNNSRGIDITTAAGLYRKGLHPNHYNTQQQANNSGYETPAETVTDPILEEQLHVEEPALQNNTAQEAVEDTVMKAARTNTHAPVQDAAEDKSVDGLETCASISMFGVAFSLLRKELDKLAAASAPAAA